MLSSLPKVSRRGFLLKGSRISAGLAALAGLVPAGVEAAETSAKPRAKPRFGLTTYEWGKEWDIPTLIANCTKARALGVELRTSESYAHGVELETTAERRREVKKRFEDSPVALVGMASGERFDWPDAAKLKTAIENAKGYLKLSHDVGSSGVRVFPNDFHKEVAREKTIAQIARAMNVLGAFAADYDQEVRLEAHGSAGDLPTLRAVMDQVTQPRVRIKLNCEKRDAQGKGFEANFNLVKAFLGNTIHAHDFKDAAFPNQLQLDLLVKLGWSGWILLESSARVPDRVQALIEQREQFEEMLARSLGQG